MLPLRDEFLRFVAVILLHDFVVLHLDSFDDVGERFPVRSTIDGYRSFCLPDRVMA
jgi:hypothetical protein